MLNFIQFNNIDNQHLLQIDPKQVYTFEPFDDDTLVPKTTVILRDGSKHIVYGSVWNSQRTMSDYYTTRSDKIIQPIVDHMIEMSKQQLTRRQKRELIERNKAIINGDI